MIGDPARPRFQAITSVLSAPLLGALDAFEFGQPETQIATGVVQSVSPSSVRLSNGYDIVELGDRDPVLRLTPRR
ncbi:hypothetical protein [Nocardia niigatensis]